MSLTPVTRKENFLARAAGNVGVELTPVTREEHFLKDIADAGGGGGSSIELITFTLEMVPGVGGAVACSHTPEQIFAALAEGKTVVAKEEKRLCAVSVTDEVISAAFDVVETSPIDDTWVGNRYFAYSDGQWSFSKRGSTIASQ